MNGVEVIEPTDKSIERLKSFREKCSIVSKARVYETDLEVAETIKSIPRDKQSLKVYRSYTFAVKKS